MANITAPPISTDILSLPVAIGLTGAEWMPDALAASASVPTAVTQRSTTGFVGGAVIQADYLAAIEYIIDGGNQNIPAEVWGYMTMPFNAAIIGASILGNAAGTISVDIWRCSLAQFDAGVTHPVQADSICGGNLISLASTVKNQVSAAALATWTPVLAANDVLAFVVPTTAIGVSHISVTLQLARNPAVPY